MRDYWNDPHQEDDSIPKEIEQIWELLEASGTHEDAIKKVDVIVCGLINKITDLENGLEQVGLQKEQQILERENYIFNVIRNQDTEYEWREEPHKKYKSIRWCSFLGESVLGEGSTELEAAENSLKIWQKHADENSD